MVVQCILIASETVGGAVHVTMSLYEMDGVERQLIAQNDDWFDTEQEYGVNAVLQAVLRSVR